MRSIVLGVVLAAVLALPVSAGAQLPVGAKMEGVEHVRNIPVNGSVGANFKGKYMFVTGTLGSPKTDPGLTTQMNYGGLWVYDVSDADDPELVSHLPVPHYENEDVSIGGNRLLISGDGTFGGSNLVVVDISNPRVPAIEQVVNMQLVDEGHTATCVQECRYAWVAGGGSIAVLRLDENAQFENAGAAPDVQIQGATSRVEAGDLPVYREFGWSTHDVQVDEAGYAWVVGGHGTIAFDTRPGSYGEANLLNPAVVARTGPDALNDEIDCGDSCNKGETVNDFIHHNSWRPDADRFRSRRDRDLRQRGVRPGETVLITEEDIWSRATGATKGGCENQGSFQTWQVKQLKATDENESTVKHLDSFTTEFNELLAKEDDVEGMDLIPTNGFCSAHYFDERDGFVATAWYEQGTRLLDVRDPTNIKQVGYFMAPDSVVWAAYWAPTDRSIIYVMDHQRGIDVLEVEWPRRHWGDRDRDDDRDRDREDRWESKRVRAPAVPSWFRQGTKLSRTRLAVDQGRPHKGFGWVCRIR